MPALTGLAETTLFVADLETSRDFYRDILGLATLQESPEGCVFRLAAGQVLLLVTREKAREPSPAPGGEVPPCHAGPGDPGGAGHLALRVPSGDLPSWGHRLRARGVEILSEVAWEGRGSSLYFRDPDGHLLELVTGDLWDHGS